MTLIPQDKLKNSNGTKYTTGLFWEMSLDRDKAVFTMTENDKDGLLAFKPLYVSLTVDDPTEYTFAKEVFGSWDHWLKLQRNKAILKFIDECRKERDVAIESRAVQQIVEEARSGKAAFQAAKFLVTKGYLDKIPKSSRNKSKANIQEEDSVDADLKRLLGE